MRLELLNLKGLGSSQAEVLKELRQKIGFLTGLRIVILKLFGVETYFLKNFGANFKDTSIILSLIGLSRLGYCVK